MKNRLLALMALCGATSSTLPLWAAWDDPVLQFTEPNLATDGTGEMCIRDSCYTCLCPDSISFAPENIFRYNDIMKQDKDQRRTSPGTFFPEHTPKRPTMNRMQDLSLIHI